MDQGHGWYWRSRETCWADQEYITGHTHSHSKLGKIVFIHQDVQYFRLWKKPEETQTDIEHPNCGLNTNPDTFHYCRGAVKSYNPFVFPTVAPFLCTTDGSRRLDTLHYSENPVCLGTWKRSCRSALTFGLWLFVCVCGGNYMLECVSAFCPQPCLSATTYDYSWFMPLRGTQQ